MFDKIPAIIQRTILGVLICSLAIPMPASAGQKASDFLDLSTSNVDFYQPNDTLCGSSSTTTSTTPSTSTPVSNFNPDPTAIDMFNKTAKPKLEGKPNGGKTLLEIYKAAADIEGFPDWQLLAGLHWIESDYSTKAIMNGFGYMGPFQMDRDTLPNDRAFVPDGRQLTDDELILHARTAIRIFIFGKAPALKTNPKQPMSLADLAKQVIGYKSGEGSPWVTGRADPNLHPYAWAGFDTTPAHKIPMPYGPTPASWGPGQRGDEKTTNTISKPGALTTFAIIKGGNFTVGSSSSCASPTAPGNGTYQPITGDRAALVQRALAGGKVVSEGTGTLNTDDRNDIQSGLTMKALKLLVGMVEQSGIANIDINIMKTGYNCPDCSSPTHVNGRAFDLNYYGNSPGCNLGSRCNNEAGNQLYMYLFTNWEALLIDELFLISPPQAANGQCVNWSGPMPCSALAQRIIDGHRNHIHVAVEPGD